MKNAILAAALLLASCASSRVSIQSSTETGAASLVKVLGERPRVKVSNLGPGEVRLRMQGAGESFEQQLGLASTMRTLEGPVVIWIEPVGKAGAGWRVVAWEAEGLDHRVVVEGYANGQP